LTSFEQSGTFSIHHGDNSSSVSGPIYTDTVDLAGIIVTDQYFSPATTLSSSFQSIPIDGILGMAFPAISKMKADPFFITAFAQGAVPSNKFGFYLNSIGSELFLGGTNEVLYTSDIEYHNINSTSGFWQISGAEAIVDGAIANSGFDTIIDSGTTIMYGVWTSIGGGNLLFQCQRLAAVRLNWGGQDWDIPNFSIGPTRNGSDQCVGVLIGKDIGLGDNVWLIGDIFMQNVYSVSSFDLNAVGFAALA